MAKRGQQASITAAARRVDLNRPAARPNRVAWHDDSWQAFDDVPEVKQFVLWRSDQMAKLRLFVGIRLTDDDRQPPVPLEAPAVADAGIALAPETIAVIQQELAGFRGDAAAGQSGLLRRMEQCLEVAGECHLVGFNVLRPNLNDVLEPPYWRVVSTKELVVRDGQFVYGETPGEISRVDGGRVIDRASDDMFRVWEPHAAFYGLADSPMRACLTDCELLVALSNQLLAETRSRSGAGFMTWPNELSVTAPGPQTPANVDPDGGQVDDDPVMTALMIGMMEPAADPSHPAAVVPIVIRGPKESLIPDSLRTFGVARPYDEHLDDRIEKRVLRLARGLSAPAEQVIGFDATTFANAQQVDQDKWEDYLQPRARFLVDAITAGYLAPRVGALGLPDGLAERLCVWFDPSDVIDSPDTSGANADSAYDRNEISGEAYRNARGFTEDDKPTPDEILERFALRRGVAAAELTAFLLGRLASEAEEPLDLTPYATPGSSGAQAAPPGGENTVAVNAAMVRLLAGDVRPKALRGYATLATVSRTTETRRAVGAAVGRRLVDIDRDLRTRTLIGANAAMVRALEKTAARLRTKSPDRAAARRLSNCDIARVIGRDAVTAALGEDTWADSWGALGVDFLAWAYAARDEAVSLLAAFAKMSTAQAEMLSTRLAGSIEDSWAWLKDTLSGLADGHLFGTTAGAVVLGEADPTLKVGAGVIRQAVARAGGTAGLDDSRGGAWVTVTTSDEDPGGLAFGAGTREALFDSGGTVEGYMWDYGPGRRQTFEPHLRLHGVEFLNFDDDVLSNTLGWPEFEFFIPGDHDGCGCDAIPTLLSAADFDVSDIASLVGDEPAD